MPSRIKIISVIIIILLVTSGIFAVHLSLSNKNGKNNNEAVYHPAILLLKKKINVLYIEVRFNLTPTNSADGTKNEMSFFCVPPILGVNETNIKTAKDIVKEDINFNDFKEVKAIIVVNYYWPWGTMLGTPQVAIFIVDNGDYVNFNAFSNTNIAYEIEYQNGLFQVLNYNGIDNPLNFTYTVQDTAKQNVTITEEHSLHIYRNVTMDEYDRANTGCD